MKSNPFVGRVNVRRPRFVRERFRVSPTSSPFPDLDEVPPLCCGKPCAWVRNPRTDGVELVCSTCVARPTRRVSRLVPV